MIPPFEVGHTDIALCELSRLLGELDGETCVVMEATGNYHLPVASFLSDSGFYVSVVNAMLVHGYRNNSLRRVKTGRKDVIKLANYGLDHWLALPRYIPGDDVRLMLKTTYQQYQQCAKVQTMLKNNRISLLDTAFPDANCLFTSPAKAGGSEKWVDFVAAFPHCEYVCGLSEKAFTAKHQKWCKKHGYNFNQDKALATLRNEMQSLAASLPEYPVMMGMFGVGLALGPQLMAEIGDMRRFHSKKVLVAFAGIDAPPHQSGQMEIRSRSISKRGSSALRRTLFLVMSTILRCSPAVELVYQFMDRKCAEGKST